MNRHDQRKRKKLERRKRRAETRQDRSERDIDCKRGWSAEDWNLPLSPVSMSDVLTDLAQPLLDQLPKSMMLEQYELIWSFAMLAWNVSRLPPDELEAARSNTLSDLRFLQGVSAGEVEGLFDGLIHRALTRYPLLPRLMVDLSITEMPDDTFKMSVVSMEFDPRRAPFGGEAATGKSGLSRILRSVARFLGRVKAAIRAYMVSKLVGASRADLLKQHAEALSQKRTALTSTVQRSHDQADAGKLSQR